MSASTDTPAGRLTKRGTLQYPVESRGTDGSVSLNWTEYATRWMAIEPLSGRELWQAQQAQAEVSHRIILKPAADGTVGGRAVVPRDRVLHGTRTFWIEAVLNTAERGTDLVLMCKEEI